MGGSPIAQRVIIVCPTSLVSNWDSECSKWLKVRGNGEGEGDMGREQRVQQVAQGVEQQGGRGGRGDNGCSRWLEVQGNGERGTWGGGIDCREWLKVRSNGEWEAEVEVAQMWE